MHWLIQLECVYDGYTIYQVIWTLLLRFYLYTWQRYCWHRCRRRAYNTFKCTPIYQKCITYRIHHFIYHSYISSGHLPGSSCMPFVNSKIKLTIFRKKISSTLFKRSIFLAYLFYIHLTSSSISTCKHRLNFGKATCVSLFSNHWLLTKRQCY